MQTPIEKVLDKLSMDASALARELILDKSTVFRWSYEKGAKGTGGNIPQKYHKDIVNIGNRHGVKITALDFSVV